MQKMKCKFLVKSC